MGKEKLSGYLLAGINYYKQNGTEFDKKIVAEMKKRNATTTTEPTTNYADAVKEAKHSFNKYEIVSVKNDNNGYTYHFGIDMKNNQ